MYDYLMALDAIKALIKAVDCAPNGKQDILISFLITKVRSTLTAEWCNENALDDDDFYFLLEKVDALLSARRVYLDEKGNYEVRYFL